MLAVWLWRAGRVKAFGWLELLFIDYITGFLLLDEQVNRAVGAAGPAEAPLFLFLLGKGAGFD